MVSVDACAFTFFEFVCIPRSVTVSLPSVSYGIRRRYEALHFRFVADDVVGVLVRLRIPRVIGASW